MCVCMYIILFYFQYAVIVESKTGSTDDKKSLAPLTTGETETKPPSASSSPGHMTRERSTTTAADVRSSIVTSQQPPPATAARRPQKNVGDSLALPGAQALAVLASVSPVSCDCHVCVM